MKHLALYCVRFCFAIVFAVILSLSVTNYAFAQEDVPPFEPEPSSTAENPEQTPETPSEELLLDTPSAGEGSSVVPTSEAAVVHPNSTIAVEPTLLVTPTPIAEGVLDEASAAEESASQANAPLETNLQDYPSSDPIWCPASAKVPKPGIGGCSISFSSLADLFDHILANPSNTDGIIWVEKTYSSNENAELDGANPNLGGMRNYRLSIRGGWNGCGAAPPATCTGSIDTTQPSELNHRLAITNWNNDVSISDILMTGAVAESALEIQTNGAINLTRVVVENNEAAGALLDNSDSTKNITVTSSKFSENSEGNGLHIVSGGAISLSGVQATNNQGHGAFLDNESTSSPKPVNVVLSSFNSNEGTGLVIESKGQITLKEIEGAENQIHGATLTNGSSPSFAGIVLQGTSAFSVNSGSGLIITSKGGISIYRLINNGNSGWGAYIENDNPIKPQSVTLAKPSEFKYNAGGVSILSSGSVTFNGVVATGNSQWQGLVIDTSSGSLPVKLQGNSVFEYNGQSGIEIISGGQIGFANVVATSNGQAGVVGYGAWLDNSAAIKPTSITLSASAIFSDNFNGGLYVQSQGLISLASVTASANGGTGLELDNDTSPESKAPGIVIKGAVQANLNGGSGLVISSKGPITTGSVFASSNAAVGAYLTNSGSAQPESVTLTAAGVMSRNTGNGLTITTNGPISLSSIVAESNGGFGAFLSNLTGSPKTSVVLKASNIFNANLGAGLSVSSLGAISIAAASANENGNIGIKLDNSLSTSLISLGALSQKVCNSASGNGSTGFEVKSGGTVTLFNTCAEGNGSIVLPGYGVFIDNRFSTTPKGVVLGGLNSYTSNYSGGLQILSKGQISVQNVTASLNERGDGMLLDNTFSGSSQPQKVILLGVSKFLSNYGNGATVNTFGPISSAGINASSNGMGGSGYGAKFDNSTGAASAASISLKGSNAFSLNSGSGLLLTSLGSIDINHLSATSNSGNGAYVTNQYVLSNGSVTLSGTSTVSNNTGNGLAVSTNGTLAIANLTASGNGGYGAALQNMHSLKRPVALSGIFEFSQNGSFGLDINTLGTITLSNVNSSGNGGYGTLLDNSHLGAKGSVVVGGIFVSEDNGGSGLEIYSNGVVDLTNLTSNSNGDFGTLVSTSAFDVKLGFGAFADNGLGGLEVHTGGAITIGAVTASGNGTSELADTGHGVYLDNAIGTLAKAIVIKGHSTSLDNFGAGFLIKSIGTVQTNGLTAGLNADGIVISNLGLSGNTNGVKMTGNNNFYSNGGYGAFVQSRGAINVSNVSASLNLAGGVELDNTFSSGAVPVVISGTNVFASNGDHLAATGAGLVVRSQGQVSANNLTAIDNAFWGARVEITSGIGAASSISITGSSRFSRNLNTGLSIIGANSVNAVNLEADLNHGDGVAITAYGNISLSCGSINNNLSYGMVSQSFGGVINLKGVFAYGNVSNLLLVAAKISNSMGCM